MSIGAYWSKVVRQPALQHEGVRLGIYCGAGLSLVFLVWIVVANRVPSLERFASDRNLAVACALSAFAVIPVVRFARSPGNLLICGGTAWSFFSLTYFLLSLYFWGLATRYTPGQILTLGIVSYMIIATVAWVGSCLWRARASHVPHSKNHVS
jgi:hypothetical protein